MAPWTVLNLADMVTSQLGDLLMEQFRSGKITLINAVALATRAWDRLQNVASAYDNVSHNVSEAQRVRDEEVSSTCPRSPLARIYLINLY
jgi:hypothetical protein